MPANVTHGRACFQYIKQFSDVVFSDVEYQNVVDSLNEIKLKRGIATDIKHCQHVQELVVSKEAAKLCSRCGSEMVVRKTKRGKNKGQQFWGCSAYPTCRSVEELN